jgi:hypothetical protein
MIAIPAFHHTDTTSHHVTFPHGLAADLEHYRQFYRAMYGADVKTPDLIREIVRCFLEQDEGFRGYKHQPKGSGRQRRTSAAHRSETAQSLPSNPLDIKPG